METVPLKSFATAARTELIREVGARLTAVLAQGSPERIEQPRAVAALEQAIAGTGGGEKGKGHVADKVAYTWFNRIIALRFMDANGYTGIGVVSPATDQVGQPEVLAAAKRGQLDTNVVKGTRASTVTALLNGTRQPRPGVDAQAEAYALLLADYCRFWNSAMPFMFEREGDYTELLIPANLLADDSVLSRSVTVLTEDVCQDVEVIGWLYQFYISERKDEVFAGFKKNKKAGADEIPAATQLFTPHWIVRYLVENSVGRLWMLNRPSSGLASQMDYYIPPVDEETDFLKIGKPEELKVIDPACGSGHMLTYAFDLLYAIYEEEGYAPSEIPGLILVNNLYGTEIDPRAGALAAFALTMKAVAKRKLFLKNPVEPNICVLDPISFSPDELSYLVTKDGDRYSEEAFWNQFAEAATFGSLISPDPDLIARLSRHLETLNDDGDMYKADALDWAAQAIRQAEFLSPRYSVVVANPPYMGGRSVSSELAAFAKDHYPRSKSDLYAMFIERCRRIVVPDGQIGMVTMQGWMFLASYEALRASLLSGATVQSLLHLGPGAFDAISGEIVTTCAFVIRAGLGESGSRGTFVRIIEPRGEAAKIAALHAALNGGLGRFDVTRRLFNSLPGKVLAYWLPTPLLDVLADGRPLSERHEAAAGMSTGDSARFLRQWYEVSQDAVNSDAATRDDARETGAKWFPYNKGGGPRRWSGYNDVVVNWKADGAEIKAWVVTNPRDPNTTHWSRRLFNLEYFFKQGVTWSAVSGADFGVRLVPQGVIPGQGSRTIYAEDGSLPSLLAVLNSAFARRIIEAFSPTLNVESGSVLRTPLPPSSFDTSHVDRAVAVAAWDWDTAETSRGFRELPGLPADNVRDWIDTVRALAKEAADELGELDALNDKVVAEAYGLGAQSVSSSTDSPTALRLSASDSNFSRERVLDLVSYAVGCMFGRYSLDEPGLIVADQGATLMDYLSKVPTPTFTPDADNVIPIVDGDWFEDDVVGLFRRFLRTAFGDPHFEENLKFVTELLGVKNLRDYFITRAGRSKFYDDHVQRYKKRPIYWLFSSPKGSFNALIYMHRYTPSTVSTVLTYLREYVTKLESALQQAERAGNAKEADRLRKILVELNDYEHDTLYPKASENVVIDLDDGVKVNYPKFGAALKKITGLEASGA